jgi:DNA-directed RNA polymerase specialized sigma24 family protein
MAEQAAATPEQQQTGAAHREHLSAWIETNEADLRRALRPLVPADVCDARGESAADTVIDLLIEVTRVALETAERFDPARSPRLWLLGIARNVVRQWRDRAIKQAARRASLPEEHDSEHSAADLFERIQAASGPGADTAASGPLWVEQALALLRPDEAQIIRLITLDGRDAAEAWHYSEH